MAVFEREVEVEVDLDDFDEDEIIEYLEDKGYTVEYNGEPEDPELSRKRLPSSYTSSDASTIKNSANTC